MARAVRVDDLASRVLADNGPALAPALDLAVRGPELPDFCLLGRARPLLDVRQVARHSAAAVISVTRRAKKVR